MCTAEVTWRAVVGRENRSNNKTRDTSQSSKSSRIIASTPQRTGLGRGPADQLDFGGPALQRLSPPVLRDVAKQPVLDLVPLCAAET
jgi:hypothetical protein